MTVYPQWSSPIRRTYLLGILREYLAKGWQCDLLSGEYYNPEYEARIRAIVDDWKIDDSENWIAERKAMHALGERRTPIRGRFNNISSDIWHGKQPLYSIEGMGLDVIKLTPFVKVKLSSSYMRLYVDLKDTLRTGHISKHQRRKAIRYGKPLPKSVENRIADKVWEAVKQYRGY